MLSILAPNFHSLLNLGKRERICLGVAFIVRLCWVLESCSAALQLVGGGREVSSGLLSVDLWPLKTTTPVDSTPRLLTEGSFFIF